ncbi:MAG: response regulator [Campylobacterales bacterium]|nr:response regulator [Campylobacterales bacterium]
MQTNSNFNILIVDDEQLNIELAAAYLKEDGYKLSFALNAQAAMEMILKKDITLILLDINMPKVDGFEVCKMLKEDKRTKDIPIVFLTAQTDIKFISRAFEVGGVDYISKPFNGIELKVRVKTHLQTLSYLNEIKQKQTKLAQLSITDHLTKLHNIFYFDAQIKNHLSSDKKFWIIYIKIDNFDKINQLYGFEKANTIIKIFSKIISSNVPSKTILSRLYGASFGILLKDYNNNVIQDLIKNISQTFFKDKELSKTISFSPVALRVSDSTSSISTIYKKLQNGINNKKGTNSLFIE